MNFDINFDFQRRDRLGLIEAIWGQDKSIDQLERLSENVLSKNEVVFITRINSEKANYLLDLYDDARFYEEANCLTIGQNLNKINTNKKVAIISGGSSDLTVTLEARLALEIYGVNCQFFIDVGVAGLHRLMSQLEEINKYDVLIFFFRAEDGIRAAQESRGLGDVYKRQGEVLMLAWMNTESIQQLSLIHI